jgi:hypothetical protein
VHPSINSFSSGSFQNDDRGSIDRLRVGGMRINLLYSKASVMRSGYLHPEPKYDFVLSGQVEVWLLTPKGTDKRIYQPHETYEIPGYTPHILHFLKDTVLAEWWEQPGESRCWVRRGNEKKKNYRDRITANQTLLAPG